MEVKFSDKTLLNKRYISEINVHENESNDFRGIMDNIRLFIEQTLRRGNCISLNDIDYSISENTFWNIEFIEDYCQNLFFTFKKGFVLKLIRKMKQLEQEDISYFLNILSSNFTPYRHVSAPGANSYQTFIGRKLKSLNKDGTLNEVKRLDKENRNRLLLALQEALNKRQDKPIPTNRRPKEEYDHLPFTKMLRPTDKSKFRTMEVIRDYLLQAGIPFEFFSKKPVKQTEKNHNPDGFNGAVAAMIHIFRELDYFAPGLTWFWPIQFFFIWSGWKHSVRNKFSIVLFLSRSVLENMNRLLPILFIMIFFFIFHGCTDCKTGYEKKVKPEIIEGVIVSRDSIHNHGIPVIEIKNANGSIEKFGLDYSLKSLWYASRMNDSIYKAKNSLAFQIIRKDTTLTFYPICGCCDTLK